MNQTNDRRLIGWANADAALCAMMATWVWKLHRDVRAKTIDSLDPIYQESSMHDLGWMDMGAGEECPAVSSPITDPAENWMDEIMRMNGVQWQCDPRCWWATMWIARLVLREGRKALMDARLKRNRRPRWSDQLSRNPNGRKPGHKVSAPGKVHGRQ